MEDNKQLNAEVKYAGRAFYVVFEDENVPQLIFKYTDISHIMEAIDGMKAAIAEKKINVVNRDSYKFFQEGEEIMTQEIKECLSQNLPEAEMLVEFEMFNVTRRDLCSFKEFIKKAGDTHRYVQSGKDISKRKFQIGYRHQITRDGTFKHPAFDDLYKSFGPKNDKERKAAEGGAYNTPGTYPSTIGL